MLPHLATVRSLFPSYGAGFTEGQIAVGQRRGDVPLLAVMLDHEIGDTCAPPSNDSIDAQRIPFNLRDEAKGLLSLWLGERWAMRLAHLLVM